MRVHVRVHEFVHVHVHERDAGFVAAESATFADLAVALGVDLCLVEVHGMCRTDLCLQHHAVIGEGAVAVPQDQQEHDECDDPVPALDLWALRDVART